MQDAVSSVMIAISVGGYTLGYILSNPVVKAF